MDKYTVFPIVYKQILLSFFFYRRLTQLFGLNFHDEKFESILLLKTWNSKDYSLKTSKFLKLFQELLLFQQRNCHCISPR